MRKRSAAEDARTGGPRGGVRPRRRSRPGRASFATLGRPALALLILSGGLVLANAFVGVESQRNALARQAAAIEGQIAAARGTNARLGADVATKKTDDYVTNKARDYGYVLPGETLIGVEPEAKAPVTVASGPSISRLERWIALFFDPR